jgi:hypothetical protein
MPRWKYSGDVNIEHGGLFWREDGADDYVLAVCVSPCSDAGGPTNMFWIEVGSIYMPTDPDKRKRALDCIGASSDNPTRDELVHAFHAYSGIDADDRRTVQIGKPERGSHEWGGFEVTDQLRGNTSLARFVRREFLHS